MPLSRIQTTLFSGETSDSVLRSLLVPPAPTNLSVTGGNGQASLSWTTPTGVIAQAPITDYSVQFSSNSGSSWTTFSDGTSTATSASVTGLTNGTAYVFRVAAVNAVGVGAYTAASAAVTPTAFAPTSIAGLQLWLDASDAGSLFDATSGGSLVAADGGVARWQDKSGNGRHATQSTSGSRPLRKAAVQGGRDVLRFDGSNDSLTIPGSTATFNFLHNGASTVFAVYKWTAPTSGANRRFLFSNHLNDESVSETTGSALWMRNDFGDASPFSKLQFLATNNGSTRTNSYTLDNSYPADTFYAVTAKLDHANATNANRAVFYKNGTVQADTAGGDGAALPTQDATYDLHICTQAGPANRLFAQCDVCEIIMYNSALSDADRQFVENYLLAKWGIT